MGWVLLILFVLFAAIFGISETIGGIIILAIIYYFIGDWLFWIIGIGFAIIAISIIVEIARNIKEANGRWKVRNSEKTVHQKRIQKLESTFGLLAKLAKFDGYISRAESEYISQILTELTENNEEREYLKAKFNYYKDSTITYQAIARDLSKIIGPDDTYVDILLATLLNLAYTDGARTLKYEKNIIISEICQIIGISGTKKQYWYSKVQSEADGRWNSSNRQSRWRESENGYRQSKQDSNNSGYNNRSSGDNGSGKTTISDPYKVLGVPSNASWNEIKRAYRKLVRKYHPDTLSGKGASQQEIRAGEEKLKEINVAYEELEIKFGK